MISHNSACFENIAASIESVQLIYFQLLISSAVVAWIPEEVGNILKTQIQGSLNSFYQHYSPMSHAMMFSAWECSVLLGHTVHSVCPIYLYNDLLRGALSHVTIASSFYKMIIQTW